MTSSGRPIEERVEELQLEVDVLRSRQGKPPYKRWQIQLYVLGTLLLGFIASWWALSDSEKFIPELVNTAAPVMLLAGGVYYMFAHRALSDRELKGPPSLIVAGNWYLASIAFVALAIGCGLLLSDKTRFALEIGLMVDTVAIVVFVAHPVTSIWSRHS